MNTEDNIQDVLMGEVVVSSGNAQLVSNALGSCIGLAVFDPQSRIGGIAHIMLPGEAPLKEINSGRQYRYAKNAIGELYKRVTEAGAIAENLCVMIVGGANVLNVADDTICRENIASVQQFLAQMHLKPCVQLLGGTLRRRIRLDIANAVLYCAEGDGPEKIVWRYEVLPCQKVEMAFTNTKQRIIIM